MTTQPPALAPAVKPEIRATVAEAWQLIRSEPKATLLPFAVIQAPIAVLSAVASAVAYLTVFEDEEYQTGGLFAVTDTGDPLFASLVLLAVNVLFAAVAQGATIVAIAAVAGGAPKSLSESLDPAFTRLGALLGVTFMVAGLLLALIFTVIGIVVVPFIALRLAMAVHALMLEDNLSPMEALRHSWKTMRGHMLRLLGVILFAALFVLPVLLLASFAVIGEDASRNERIAFDTTLSIAQGIITIPVVTFVLATTTVFYLKIREGAQ